MKTIEEVMLRFYVELQEWIEDVIKRMGEFK